MDATPTMVMVMVVAVVPAGVMVVECLAQTVHPADGPTLLLGGLDQGRKQCPE